jgi:hypothetical protein
MTTRTVKPRRVALQILRAGAKDMRHLVVRWSWLPGDARWGRTVDPNEDAAEWRFLARWCRAIATVLQDLAGFADEQAQGLEGRK